MEPSSKKTRSLIAIIVFLLLSNIALLIFFLTLSGKPDKPNRNHDRNGMQESLKTEVGFDQKQLDSYQQLREEHMKKIKPLFEDIRAAKDSLYSLLYVENLSDSIINKTAVRIGEKQMLLDKEVFTHFKNVRLLNRPEQLSKFDTVFKRVIDKMTGRGKKTAPKKVDSK